MKFKGVILFSFCLPGRALPERSGILNKIKDFSINQRLGEYSWWTSAAYDINQTIDLTFIEILLHFAQISPQIVYTLHSDFTLIVGWLLFLVQFGFNFLRNNNLV